MRLKQNEVIKRLHDFYLDIQNWMRGEYTDQDFERIERKLDSNFTFVHEGKIMGIANYVESLKALKGTKPDIELSFDILRSKRIDATQFLIVYNLNFQNKDNLNTQINSAHMKCNPNKENLCDLSHIHVSDI